MIVIVFPFFLLLFLFLFPLETEKLRFLSVHRQTHGPSWRRTEILVSLHKMSRLPVSMMCRCCYAYVCVCVCVCIVGGRTRKEDAFKSRTSLKSCRRPTEKRTFTEMQWTIKRDWISVAAVVRFLREVDDNVQVAMTNEEQKEAGTEPFPSLFFSRFFSLIFSSSETRRRKNHLINFYLTRVCAFLHVQWEFFTNHNEFSLSLFLLFRYVFSVRSLARWTRRERKRKERLGGCNIYWRKWQIDKVLRAKILRKDWMYILWILD